MSSASTLVNVVPDAEQKLVRVLSVSSSTTSTPVPSSFVGDCDKAISNGDAAQLIRIISGTKGAINSLFALSDDEATSAASLLAALLNRAVQDDASVGGQLLESLSSSIVQCSTDETTTKKAITLLATLYNIRSDPNDKVSLLVKMTDLASTQKPQLLDPKSAPSSSSTSSSYSSTTLGKYVMDPTYLSTMLDEWNIPPSGRRTLYRSAASAATAVATASSSSSSSSDNNNSSIAQHFVLLEVETYMTAADVATPASMEAATKAAIGSIRDPVTLFTIQRKLLSLPAIQALETKSGPLFALLKVFQEGDLQEYKSYLQANGGESVLSQWNLSADECSKNMRVLSMCSLASQHEVIPYQTVAEKLDVPATDVEKWVITAASSGLLRAKMDQMEQKVVVEQCVLRKCDMEQWKALQSRLHLWKDNIGEVLKQAMKAQSVQ